jgi:hypothetical protein
VGKINEGCKAMTTKLTPAGEALEAVKAHKYGRRTKKTINDDILDCCICALEMLDRIQRGETKELRREPTREMSLEGLVGFTNSVAEINGPHESDAKWSPEELENLEYFRSGRITHNSRETDDCFKAHWDAAPPHSATENTVEGEKGE